MYAQRMNRLLPSTPKCNFLYVRRFSFAVFTHLPLAFSVDLEACGIENQMADWPIGAANVDIYILSSLADTAVRWATQLNAHQGKE